MGGGMGGGGQSTTSGSSHQVTKIELPKWVEDASQENYQYAKALSGRPYEGYSYNVWPEFDPRSIEAMNRVMGESDRYRTAYEDPINAVRSMLGWGNVEGVRDKVNNVDRGDLKEFMNPYTDEVVSRTMSGMETEAMKARRALDVQGQQAKAFGGSRHEIEQAVLGGEALRGMGDTEAKLRERSYDKAREYQTADWGREFQNRGLDLKNIDNEFRNRDIDFKNREMLQSGAKTLSGLAGAAQQGQSTDYFNMLSVGKMKEDQMRERLEEDYKKWQKFADHDEEMINLRLAALGMSPYGRTETTDKTETSTTKQKGGGDLGSGILGGMGLLKGLMPLMGMSDRSMKTNIEELGKDPATDLPVYAYDYKADVKGKKTAGPKRVGYMAQDVEKKYPQAVRKVAGKRVIDFTQIPMVA